MLRKNVVYRWFYWYTVNESKLAQYLIFKAKQNGTIEKRHKNDKYVLSKKCFVDCNIKFGPPAKSFNIGNKSLGWIFN